MVFITRRGLEGIPAGRGRGAAWPTSGHACRDHRKAQGGNRCEPDGRPGLDIAPAPPGRPQDRSPGPEVTSAIGSIWRWAASRRRPGEPRSARDETCFVPRPVEALPEFRREFRHRNEFRKAADKRAGARGHRHACAAGLRGAVGSRKTPHLPYTHQDCHSRLERVQSRSQTGPIVSNHCARWRMQCVNPSSDRPRDRPCNRRAAERSRP
jgi:hypothetical protein